MNTKHTPGPWSRNIRAGGKYPVVFAGRNQHAATVCQQRDGAETEANIDLIAAAPDMLAALCALLAAIDCGGHEEVVDASNPLCVKSARAAIATATGVTL